MSLKSLTISAIVFGAMTASMPAFSAQDEEQEPAIDYMALTAEVADTRKVDPIFIEAFNEGYLEAILHLGQIGTHESCRRIDHYIGDPSANVRLYATSAAALCLDKASVPALVLQIEREQQPIVKGALYRSLGLTGREDARRILIKAVNDTASTDQQMAVLGGALEGLMQNIVYANIEAEALDPLKFRKLLKLTRQNSSEETAFRAAYLMTRISGLEKRVKLADVRKAYTKSRHESVKTLLVRIAARMDTAGQDEAQGIDFFTEIIKGDNQRYRFEAITALGRMSGNRSEVLLWDIAQDEQKAVSERQQALSALIARIETKSVDMPKLAGFLKELEQATSPWLRAKSLAGHLTLDRNAGEALALEKLKSQNYYEAFQAIAALSRTDSGKAKLTDFIEKSDNYVRAQEARIALDPSIEAKAKPRPTEPYEIVSKSQGKITLKTTKGLIEIETVEDAPYASHNFVTLVKEGKLDGMIWHRVIPNFVAQAGQKEDTSLYEWGSIREEWAAGPHVVGSVGLATAGKDTGGTQFFINTNRNMHLNGRYTVFGHISAGMDIVLALGEGDVIETATFEASKTEEK